MLLPNIGAFSNLGEALDVAEIDLLPEANAATRRTTLQPLQMPQEKKRRSQRKGVRGSWHCFIGRGGRPAQRWWLTTNPTATSEKARQRKYHWVWKGRTTMEKPTCTLHSSAVEEGFYGRTGRSRVQTPILPWNKVFVRWGECQAPFFSLKKTCTHITSTSPQDTITHATFSLYENIIKQKRGKVVYKSPILAIMPHVLV